MDNGDVTVVSSSADHSQPSTSLCCHPTVSVLRCRMDIAQLPHRGTGKVEFRSYCTMNRLLLCCLQINGSHDSLDLEGI
jgi:hypothetical protein